MRLPRSLSIVACLATGAAFAETPEVAVGPQYVTTHVYVAPEDFDRFVASFFATFGGHASGKAEVTVTPTPSKTFSQVVWTPSGNVSVFGFTTPIPYPFGAERTGSLVTDIDTAVEAAKASGAAVLVAPFADTIGRDAIIQWPGGVDMQLYWHTAAPSYAPLASNPEARIYLPPERAEPFIQDFLTFSHGIVESDDSTAPGVEIGRPGETYRRVRIDSAFGRETALISDRPLPWPYGRELTGYEVSSLTETLAKAKAAGAKVLAGPYAADGREAAMVEFPGGYVAELHAPIP